MERSRTILYIEDDAEDRELMQHTAKQVGESVNFVYAENGLKALEYLTVAKNNLRLPCLIVLDLNMPVLDGKETFYKIKNEPMLETIPIVIFTSSSNPGDRSLFESLGVGFITKPYNLSDMSNIVRGMIDLCNK